MQVHHCAWTVVVGSLKTAVRVLVLVVVVPLGGPEAGELDTHRPVRVRPQNVNVRAALIHVLGGLSFV